MSRSLFPERKMAGTVGVVEVSRNPKFAIGETVLGTFGWQEYGISDGRGLMKVDTRAIPMSAYLGPVGMPGVTAWYGLNRICAPKAGETVLVSAASGAVGSVVGQLAKAAGCRAVGIAGGPDKCGYVTSELGFDSCIDHRAPPAMQSITRAIRAAGPSRSRWADWAPSSRRPSTAGARRNTGRSWGPKKAGTLTPLAKGRPAGEPKKLAGAGARGGGARGARAGAPEIRVEKGVAGGVREVKKG